MSIDINSIVRYLPHRFPFLLVDRILEIKRGESIVGLKNITINEAHFMGHFPGYPVMPGVLIVEALAQTSGILTLETMGVEYSDENLFLLAGIDNTRFKRMVIPGDQLRLEVKILKQKNKIWKFHGLAIVDDEVACEAEFMNIRR